MRRSVGFGRLAAAELKLPITVEWGRAVGGAGKGACGGGDRVLRTLVGGAEELLTEYRAGDRLRGWSAEGGIGVNDDNEDIGVPDSSFDSDLLGSCREGLLGSLAIAEGTP